MIFLTSSLGLEIFSSAANPVFPWGLAWIFQEPGGFPKINETVLFHKSFRGEKIIPSHHSVACIDSTAEHCWALLLQLVLTGSAWQLDLESGCGFIKTFNKIILKPKKKKSSCSGLTIDLFSQATPRGPGSPAFKMMHRSTSEWELLCSHMYVCHSVSVANKAPAPSLGSWAA